MLSYTLVEEYLNELKCIGGRKSVYMVYWQYEWRDESAFMEEMSDERKRENNSSVV